MMPKQMRLLRRLVGGGGRESASFGAALLGVLLLAGAAFGNGISRTSVEVSDGLTWLGDDQRGEVVQVNPASGKPQTRLQISGADAQLEIAQEDGRLIVLDRRTGQITVIDLATLLASGRRQAPAGASAKVLVSAGHVFVVDRAAGTVHTADPVTLADVGAAWQAGQPLADAVVDRFGVLWVVDHGGTLRALEWSDDEERFEERSHRAISGAGPRTVLVPHDRGVTLIGLDAGVVVQGDRTTTTVSLSGEVIAAQTSPDDLVPASVPSSGTVVLVVDGQVVQVDVSAFGCPKPGRPAVFRDRVYVPCRGSGKVIVLDRGGKRGGDDVPTSGDAELVFDDGRLFVNVPGSSTGVLIDADGSTRSVTIRSPELQVTNPDRPPMPTVPPPPPPRPNEPIKPPRGNNPDSPPASDAPPSSAPPSSVPPGALAAPTGISIREKSRGAGTLTVTVSWTAPSGPVVGYTVTASGGFSGGSQSTQVSGTSADLTLPCGGSTFCTNGRLDVSVSASSGTATGPAGAASWTVTGGTPVTTTTPPKPTTTTTTPPPVVTTTTTPPVVVPTTTTPPPPPPLPPAGATVITSITGLQTSYSRKVNMAPPPAWASHNGRCEVVNTTLGNATPIACNATVANIEVDYGTNRIVVRAYAASGSGQVDSAPRNATMREDMCGTKPCQIPRSIESNTVPAGVGGLGLLACAYLLRISRRNEEE